MLSSLFLSDHFKRLYESRLLTRPSEQVRSFFGAWFSGICGISQVVSVYSWKTDEAMIEGTRGISRGWTRYCDPKKKHRHSQRFVCLELVRVVSVAREVIPEIIASVQLGSLSFPTDIWTVSWMNPEVWLQISKELTEFELFKTPNNSCSKQILNKIEIKKSFQRI